MGVHPIADKLGKLFGRPQAEVFFPQEEYPCWGRDIQYLALHSSIIISLLYLLCYMIYEQKLSFPGILDPQILKLLKISD